jgi:transglutaminase/protease-like cytokinesis protein 3
MHKISEGYFYEVYDLGNNRVLKKKRPFLKIMGDVRKEYESNFFTGVIKTFQHIRKCTEATSSVRKKMEKIPHSLLGNPRFINKVEYEQDKAVLLMDYFTTHSTEENKVVIDKYSALVKEFLKYGVHDYVYKFKNSYGINSNGEVVFIDFNEVTFSKDKTLEYIKIKEWRNDNQFRKFPEGELKEYLDLKLSEVCTQENVSNLWEMSLVSGEVQ